MHFLKVRSCMAWVLYNIKCMGLKCKLLNLIECFLFGRQRSVVTKDGMPQGSVLGPFFRYILMIYQII